MVARNTHNDEDHFCCVRDRSEYPTARHPALAGQAERGVEADSPTLGARPHKVLYAKSTCY